MAPPEPNFRTAIKDRAVPNWRQGWTLPPPAARPEEATQTCSFGLSRSDLFEVDALDHGQALQETAQAIECQFDRAEPDPFAPAEDA